MKEIYNIDSFKKRKDLLLCVNSSGTAINSMDINHKLCYGSSFIDVWNLQDKKDIVQEIWNEINLYEKTRGINRFIGLLAILKRINGILIPYESLSSLEDWVHKFDVLPAGSLDKEIVNNPDPLLIKALAWSNLIDQKMSSIELKEKIAYKYVFETLKSASENFDIAVISGASQQVIKDEWQYNNILQFVDVIGSQEEGSKKESIAKLIQKGYDVDNVIMVGDSLSDYESAKSNGILFYPIIINDEVSCWNILNDYYLRKIIKHDFLQHESSLINMFTNNFVKDFIKNPDKKLGH